MLKGQKVQLKGHSGVERWTLQRGGHQGQPAPAYPGNTLQPKSVKRETTLPLGQEKRGRVKGDQAEANSHTAS